jgi:hypothetical protein
MSADRDRGIRRIKQKRAKAQKRDERQQRSAGVAKRTAGSRPLVGRPSPRSRPPARRQATQTPRPEGDRARPSRPVAERARRTAREPRAWPAWPKVIGVLSPYAGADVQATLAAFRQAMRDLGYVEGRGFTLVERFAEGENARCRRSPPSW